MPETGTDVEHNEVDKFAIFANILSEDSRYKKYSFYLHGQSSHSYREMYCLPDKVTLYERTLARTHSLDLDLTERLIRKTSLPGFRENEMYLAIKMCQACSENENRYDMLEIAERESQSKVCDNQVRKQSPKKKVIQKTNYHHVADPKYCTTNEIDDQGHYPIFIYHTVQSINQANSNLHRNVVNMANIFNQGNIKRDETDIVNGNLQELQYDLKISDLTRFEDIDKELHEPPQSILSGVANLTEADILVMEAAEQYRGIQVRQKQDDSEEMVVDANILADEESLAEIEEAATKIQAAFRGFQLRQKDKVSDETLSENAVGDSTGLAELEEAATKIQAAFRGFHVRNKGDVSEESSGKNAVDTEDNTTTAELEEAATKIQAAFRGFHVRNKGDVSEESSGKNAVDTEDNTTTAELEEAATKIQAAFRGFHVRNKGDVSEESSGKNAVDTEDNTTTAELEEAATKIQAAFRGFHVRNKGDVSEESSGKNAVDTEDNTTTAELEEAATKIQAAFRGFHVRNKGDVSEESSGKNAVDTEDNTTTAELEEAATKIQAAFRGFHVRNKGDVSEESSGKNAVDTEDNTTTAELEEAATKIQAAFRGFHVRNKGDVSEESSGKNAVDTEDNTTTAELEEAATKIQAAFRGFHVRNKGDVSEESSGKMAVDTEDNTTTAELEEAATKIQAAFRGFHVRNKGDVSEESSGKNAVDTEDNTTTAELEEAATKIQAAFRGFHVRNKGDVSEESSGKNAVDTEDNTTTAELEEAATKIQAAFRGFHVRNKGDVSEESSGKNAVYTEDNTTIAELEEAATKIQAAFRGFHVRNKGDVSEESSGKNAVDTEDNTTIAKLEEAATKIQAAFRGSQVRNQAKPQVSTTPHLSNLKEIEAVELEEAATKIQAAFRGFRIRNQETGSVLEIKPLNLGDLTENEVVGQKIQSAHRECQENDNNEIEWALTNEKIAEFEGIGSSGLQSRQKYLSESIKVESGNEAEDTTDFKNLTNEEVSELEEAALKIQSAYRGFQSRRKSNASDFEGQDNLADENDDQPQWGLTNEEIAEFEGTTKGGSQSGQRSPRSESVKVESGNEAEDAIDLKNLTNEEVSELEEAALKIQSAYRGFQTRRKSNASDFEGQNNLANENDEQPQWGLTNEEIAEFEGTTKGRSQSGQRSPRSESVKVESGNEAEDAIDLKNMTNKEVSELEEAALKIQSAYRGFQARRKSNASDFEGQDNLANENDDQPHLALTNEEIAESELTTKGGSQSGQRSPRSESVKVESGNEAEDAIDLQNMTNEEVSELEGAALKIQSAYRGFQARRRSNASDFEGQDNLANENDDQPQWGLTNEEIAEFEGTTKGGSQSGQRSPRSESVKVESGNEAEDAIDLKNLTNKEVSELEETALKIQSAYRGFQARRRSNASDFEGQDNLANENDDQPQWGLTNEEIAEFEGTTKGGSQSGQRSPRSESVKVESGNEAEDAIDLQNMTNEEVSELEGAALKIQSVYRGFQARRRSNASDFEGQDNFSNENENEPQWALTNEEIAEFKGTTKDGSQSLKVESGNEAEDTIDLKNLTNYQVSELEEAALKIQSAYRGFQARRKSNASDFEGQENLGSENDDQPQWALTNEEIADFERTIKPGSQSGQKSSRTQSVKVECENEAEDTIDLKNLTNEEVSELEEAALKIQSAYRGFQSRRKSNASDFEGQDNLADENEDEPQWGLTNEEIAEFEGTTKGGSQSGQRSPRSESVKVESGNEAKDAIDLKNLTNEEVSELEEAALKIQSAYRGFQSRRKSNASDFEGQDNLADENEDEPQWGLTNEEIAEFEGTTKGGSQSGQRSPRSESVKVESGNEAEDAIDLKNLTNEEVSELEEAALKIQSAYRGFQARRKSNASDFEGRDNLVNENDDQPQWGLTNEEIAEFEGTTKGGSQSGQRSPRSESVKVESGNEAEDAIDLKNLTNEEVSELEEAALKVQSAYRGFQARRKSNASDFEGRDNLANENEDEPQWDLTNEEIAEFQGTSKRGLPSRRSTSHLLSRSQDNASNERTATTGNEFSELDVGIFAKSREHISNLFSGNIDIEELQEAATKIQAAFRGFQVRRTSCVSLGDVSMNDLAAAATKIQAVFRGFRVRRSMLYEYDIGARRRSCVTLEDIEMAQLQNAATTIQAAFRGHRVRRMSDVSSEEINRPYFFDNRGINMVELQQAAIKIQATFKEFQGRRKYLLNEDTNRQDVDELEEAATKIQAAFRGFQVRRRSVVSVEEMNKGYLFSERPPFDIGEVEEAAVKIQAAFRGFQARRQIVVSLQNLNQSDIAELEDAATRIQAAFRGFQVRRRSVVSPEEIKSSLLFHTGGIDMTELEEAATKIQALFRGFQVRRKSYTPLEAINESDAAQLEDAATTIQAAFRGFQVRKRKSSLVSPEEIKKCGLFDTGISTSELEEAATKIQAAFRGFQVRRKSCVSLETINENDMVELNEAATKIEEAFRGNGGRPISPETGSPPKLRENSVPSHELLLSECFELLKAATKIELVFRGSQIHSGTAEESLVSIPSEFGSSSSKELSELHDAATKIRSLLRRFLYQNYQKCGSKLPVRLHVSAD